MHFLTLIQLECSEKNETIDSRVLFIILLSILLEQGHTTHKMNLSGYKLKVDSSTKIMKFQYHQIFTCEGVDISSSV